MCQYANDYQLLRHKTCFIRQYQSIATVSVVKCVFVKPIDNITSNRYNIGYTPISTCVYDLRSAVLLTAWTQKYFLVNKLDVATSPCLDSTEVLYGYGWISISQIKLRCDDISLLSVNIFIKIILNIVLSKRDIFSTLPLLGRIHSTHAEIIVPERLKGLPLCCENSVMKYVSIVP